MIINREYDLDAKLRMRQGGIVKERARKRKGESIQDSSV
jgi:hypothetical protein